MRFKIYSGFSEKIAEDQFKLMPYAGLPGLLLTGSEDDRNYELWCNVKIIDSDRASLVCGFSEDENYRKRFVEFCVDYANQRLMLYLWIESESPMPVEALGRLWKIDCDKPYYCGIRLKDDYVLCYIDGVEVFRFDYLGEVLQKGMFGFKVDGPDGKYAIFSNIFAGAFGAKDFCDKVYNRVKLSQAEVPLAVAWQLIQTALQTASSELDKTLDFLSLAPDEDLLIQDLAGIYFLCYATGGTATGLSFRLGDLSVSPIETGEAASIFTQLQNEVYNLLLKLKQPYVGVV